MTTRFTEAYIQPGETLTLVAPYAVAGGGGAKVGALFGVAKADVESGAEGEFQMCGVHYLAKTTSQAWTQGGKLYWDDSTKKLTTDGTAGMLVGAATADAGSSDTFGYCKLNGTAPAMLEGPEAAVADVATADADSTYGAAEATLINEIKTQLNALLARLRLNGAIAP